MFLELVATFAAGIGAAGLVLLLNIASGRRLPRWLMPVAAGAAMIGITIWSEMTWADRTAATLPPGVEVAERVSRSAWWRPWTYVWPQTTRFMAVDTASVRSNEAAPGTRLVDLYLFGRWQRPAGLPQLVRCTEPARADVSDAALSDPAAAAWRPEPAGSDLIRLVCEGEVAADGQ